MTTLTPETVTVSPDELRQFRRRFWLTQEELAAHLGLANGNTVSFWENGRRIPSPTLRRALRDLRRQLVAQEQKETDRENQSRRSTHPVQPDGQGCRPDGPERPENSESGQGAQRPVRILV